MIDELTERETFIMYEAFMTGRVYTAGNEKESIGEIDEKLHANCMRALKQYNVRNNPVQNKGE